MAQHSTQELRKALKDGHKVTPLEGWAKDEPALTYAPSKPRDIFPWVAADGRRYRAMQLRII